MQCISYLTSCLVLQLGTPVINKGWARIGTESSIILAILVKCGLTVCFLADSAFFSSLLLDKFEEC